MANHPAQISLTCLGTGDAFGTGGRLQSCYHIAAGQQLFLLDCGCSVLSGLKRQGLSAAQIDTVFISHLHGDHFGGIPFLLLDGKYGDKRSKPLTLIGPPGLQEAVAGLANILYPGTFSSGVTFPVKYVTLAEGTVIEQDDYQVRAWRMRHGSSDQVYGLRLRVAGRDIAYSGDTEWVDNLRFLAAGSDLFIVECCGYQQSVVSHLDYRTLLARRAELDCRRMVLTHMGQDVLSNKGALEIEFLNDGDVLFI